MIQHYATRRQLLASIPQHGIIAEVGVFAGDFAAEILAVCQPKELHLIDCWSAPVTCSDPQGQNTRKVTDMAALYQEVAARFQSDPRVVLHWGDSVETLDQFAPGYFDFIYVDGDHSYEGCWRDLVAAARATRSVMGGHDYQRRKFPGVVRAVDEFCAAQPWRLTHLADDYFPSYVLQRAA